LIRDESRSDLDSIRGVNRQAFGRNDEARLVDSLRNGGYGRISLVADVQGQTVGHILFSRLAIATDREDVEALALAPLAVLPTHQNRGIGSALVREGLRLGLERGHRIVFVLGHPEYYARFGFSPALASPIRSCYAGESFMAMELVPGALARLEGDARYPPPFAAL
jgi:putative acetyltransferase